MSRGRSIPCGGGAALLALLACFVLGACRQGGDAGERKSAARKKKLQALPYLSVVEDERHPDRVRVVRHDRKRAQPGFNLFGSRERKTAYLLDMQGQVLQEWKPVTKRGANMYAVTLDADGSLLAVGFKLLAKIGWDSGVLWQEPNPRSRFHHEITLGPGGDRYALNSKVRWLKRGGGEIPIRDDVLTVLSPTGELKQELSIWDLVGERVPASALEAIAKEGKTRATVKGMLAMDTPFDLFHTNTVTFVRKPWPGVAAGELLLCVRNLNLVFTVDLAARKVTWVWEGGVKALDRPHYPVQTAAGAILIFDNGWHRGHSRLVELDPRTGKITWQFVARRRASFFSKKGGMAQPLPNGNMLVTEQDRGRVFEITRAGKVVWEFYNFNFNAKKQRETIYRMVRLTPQELQKLPLSKEVKARLGL